MFLRTALLLKSGIAYEWDLAKPELHWLRIERGVWRPLLVSKAIFVEKEEHYDYFVQLFLLLSSKNSLVSIQWCPIVIVIVIVTPTLVCGQGPLLPSHCSDLGLAALEFGSGGVLIAISHSIRYTVTWLRKFVWLEGNI